MYPGTRPIPSSQPRLIVALIYLSFIGLSDAAELIRGPYLQTGTPTSMRLRWRTEEPTASVVFYGENEGLLLQVEGNLQPTIEHDVQLHALEPDTRYYYSIGDLTETLVQGPEYHFRTSPLPGSQKPIRIWAIGDCGTLGLSRDEHQREVRDAYLAYQGTRQTDVWIALGDNAYLSGTDEEYQLRFFNIYPALLRNTVLWPTLGNHELYGDPEDGVFSYFKNFSLPTKGEAGGVASGTENYYSFDHGNVHFICLDSEEAPFKGGDPMYRWLLHDLAANTNQWLIAYWHSPPYSKGSHDSDDEYPLTYMRRFIVPVLESYGVDLVLSGHSHIYERTFLLHGHYGDSTTLTEPMKLDGGGGHVANTGPYHKTTRGPNAGKGTVYVVAGSSGWATFRFGFHPAMYYDALDTGSLVIDVVGDRLDAKFLRETGKVDDAFTILKDSEPPAFQIMQLQRREADLVGTFKSTPGALYAVEYAEDLTNPNWIRLGTTVRATGATTTWQHPVAELGSSAFLRMVEVEPAP